MRQGLFKRALLDSQPIDRVFRIPFDFFAGLIANGAWTPGLHQSAQAERIITRAEFSDDGRFRFLNGILRTAR